MKPTSFCLTLTILGILNFTIAQNTQKEMMANLQFMTGEWIGTSTSFDDRGVITNQVAAFQNIQYGLGKSIIQNLKMENLSLPPMKASDTFSKG